MGCESPRRCDPSQQNKFNHLLCRSASGPHADLQRYHASRPRLEPFAQRQFSEDCIVNMLGFNLRQGQPPLASTACNVRMSQVRAKRRERRVRMTANLAVSLVRTTALAGRPPSRVPTALSSTPRHCQRSNHASHPLGSTARSLSNPPPSAARQSSS
jgi:hypothetical protein